MLFLNISGIKNYLLLFGDLLTIYKLSLIIVDLSEDLLWDGMDLNTTEFYENIYLNK